MQKKFKPSKIYNLCQDYADLKKNSTNEKLEQGKQHQNIFAFATKVKNYQIDFNLSSSCLTYFQLGSNTSCMKCGQVSTKWYPLQLPIIDENLRSGIKSRK